MSHLMFDDSGDVTNITTFINRLMYVRGSPRCEGDLAARETMPCDKYCTSQDTEIKVMNNRFIIA